MTQRIYTTRPSFGTSLVGMLAFFFVIYLLFKLAAFTVETLVTGLPFFFGLGLVLGGIAYLIDKRVPISFLKGLKEGVQKNPLRGTITALASVLFAPFVGVYLLGKAMLVSRFKGAMEEFQRQAEHNMAQQAGNSLGDTPTAYTEVKQADGLVIRIPNKEE